MPAPQRVETSFRIPLRKPEGPKAGEGRVELLAPAGSFEALVAAVENGADAVYLAGEHFGARKFARNFSNEELRKAVDFAHVRGARVFLTVNTLVFNREFEELVPFLKEAREAGVDACIVQDLGVMRLLRDAFGDFPVHISTQATVHNSKGIGFLEALGAERVILARENTLKDIRKMKVNTNAELEHFVHGAMCYCYSGQCLMSSVIGERSGNRGACAYTCRLPFTLEDSEGERAEGAPPTVLDPVAYRSVPHVREKHVLSSKDLHNLEEIPQLIDAGVTSFKIEGRMKRPEYVAVVTRAYRNAIDRYYAGNFHLTPEEREHVARIFNREFTPGYLEGKEKWDFTNWDTAGNRGTPLGEVVASGKGWVKVRLNDTLRVRDGIEILHLPRWGREKGGAPEEYGFEVRQMLPENPQGRPRFIKVAHPGQVVELRGEQRSAPGDPVYKTADIETLEVARTSYQGAPHRRVPVKLTARLMVGKPIEIRLETTWSAIHHLNPDRALHPAAPGTPGFAVTHETAFLVQEAQKAPLDAARVKDQLARFGETVFDPAEVEVHLDRKAFAPIREINEARRAACEALERQIASRYHRSARPIGPEELRAFRFPRRERPARTPKLAVNCWTLPNLEAALAAGAEIVYFSGLSVGGLQPRWDFDALESAFHLAREHGARLYVASGMIQKDHEVEMLREAVRRGKGRIAGVLAGNHGACRVAVEEGVPWIADWPMNVYNSVTVDFLKENGAERITLSPELTLDEMRDVALHTTEPLEALVHGRLTLMTSEYCSIGHATRCQMEGGTWAPCHDRKYRLNDRVNANFALETDGACRMYILNSVELSMVNHVDKLAQAGLDVIRIETIGTLPQAVEAQVETYLDVLARHQEDPGTAFTQAHWARLRDACPDGFTTGHFFRGPA